MYTLFTTCTALNTLLLILIKEIIFYSEIPCFRDYYNSHMKLWLNKTCSWHTLRWTKPIPSIGYVQQNLFLAYIMLEKTIWDLVVKVCKLRCIPRKKIIS